MRIRLAIDKVRRHRSGQDLIEYALLGAFIAMMVTAAAPFGTALNDWYQALAGVGQAGSGSTQTGNGASPSPGQSHCSGTGEAHSGGKCKN